MGKMIDPVAKTVVTTKEITIVKLDTISAKARLPKVNERRLLWIKSILSEALWLIPLKTKGLEIRLRYKEVEIILLTEAVELSV